MKEEKEESKPVALSAFLTPPSRFIQKEKQTNTNETKDLVNKTNYVILTPEQISQKVASLLKPGPPFYSEISSADLIENLSNASLMRCDGQLPKQSNKVKGWFDEVKKSITTASTEQEQEQEQPPWTGVGTVWSALDSLPSGTAAFNLSSVNGKLVDVAKSEEDDGLWSSVMLACDLNGNNLHVTQSCVIPTSVLFENHFYQGNKKALFETIGAGTTYKWDDWSKEQISTSSSYYLALYTMPSIEAWQWPSWVPYLGQKGSNNQTKQPSSPNPTPAKGSKRIWVPSTTQVSVHATWWGYTLYIPACVFPELDSDVNQAEKIANLIHTVLMTILNNSSKLPIPVALQAALTILKAIAPSTSYISTFIGWSWNEIKSFNTTGQGVELSATWLLPIALIPHTWDAATAPADKNGDGTPDGPPTEPTEPQPQPSVPSSTETPASDDQPDDQPQQSVPEQPTTTEPTSEEPATETPAAETPAEETPATETPSSDIPTTDTPVPEVPNTETPTPETPAEETPSSTETPSEEEPTTTEESAVPEASQPEEIVESEPILEEESKVEEVPEELSSEERVEKEEAIATQENETVAEAVQEEVPAETIKEEEEHAESSDSSIATEEEPVTPQATTLATEDPLLLASEQKEVSPPTPEKELITTPVPTVEVKSTKKIKGTKKLFGKKAK